MDDSDLIVIYDSGHLELIQGLSPTSPTAVMSAGVLLVTSWVCKDEHIFLGGAVFQPLEAPIGDI